MMIAKRTDWKIEPLPSRKTSVALDRSFGSHEMERIRRGLVPAQMEDKWFVFWEDDRLFFHRSWTGFCIYIAHFTSEGSSSRMVSADVNRDPDQYTGVSDERDAKLILYLVDALLLQRSAGFPHDKANPVEPALETWSMVGRAALGEQPDDAS